jgi:hypothetical protein
MLCAESSAKQKLRIFIKKYDEFQGVKGKDLNPEYSPSQSNTLR